MKPEHLDMLLRMMDIVGDTYMESTDSNDDHLALTYIFGCIALDLHRIANVVDAANETRKQNK